MPVPSFLSVIVCSFSLYYLEGDFLDNLVRTSFVLFFLDDEELGVAFLGLGVYILLASTDLKDITLILDVESLFTNWFFMFCSFI